MGKRTDAKPSGVSVHRGQETRSKGKLELNFLERYGKFIAGAAAIEQYGADAGLPTSAAKKSGWW